MDRPTIAITMGDAAGIGPELIVKLLSGEEAHRICQPLVVGDLAVMETIGRVLGSDLQFRCISDPSQAQSAPPVVDVFCPPGLEVPPDAWGTLDPQMGEAAAACLRAAFDLAGQGRVEGVLLAPMNKEAFHLAGYDYLDELVYLNEWTHSDETYMMGVIRDRVWTVAVTEHVPFRAIADLIVRDRVARYIGYMHKALKRTGLPEPRIAVAALNVHAGEGGLFGREEIDDIGPAIEDARAAGIDARGPVPADAVFGPALAGAYDGVVCMYHDQANIARKLQPVHERSTLYMGLPVVCGTTTHGTAFDIAGKGIAEVGGLATALRHVVALVGGNL